MLVSEGVAAATHFCCVIEHHLRTHHPRWIWCFGSAFWHTEVCSRFPRKAYAKFTSHDFSPIFHSPTDFDKSQTNRARSREWQSHSVNYQDAIWGHRRCVADTCEIFGILNIWSCRRFIILLCEWVLTEKYISDDLQPMREQDTGQREAWEGLLFFYKAINVSYLQTMCTHLALEYTDQVGYMKMKGLGFPVNNILLWRTKYVLHFYFSSLWGLL